MNHKNNRDFQLAWKEITKIIRNEVGDDTFHRWFKAVQLLAADETQITLRVPNNIHQLWIGTNYMGLLYTSILKVLGSPRKVRFTIADMPQEKVTEPYEAAAAANGMNLRNTFDSFVVGPNNQFAHAAALAVAQNPVNTYNPLFIYGRFGLGKTHLMHAIGQYVAVTKKGAKVVYLSSQKFTNEFTDAIKNSTLARFRNKYRHADVLLIDDIQLLAGDERCEEEFFHIFDSLLDGQKQIVLSSDRPLSEIPKTEGRLASLFEWGLIAELQPPDIETRVAILRKKVELIGNKLDSSILEFLAQQIKSNVRVLEGALMRVASFAFLSGRELTPDVVERLLNDILQKESESAGLIPGAVPDLKNEPRITFDE